MLDNIDPKYWGKTYWDFIYTVGVSYPEKPTEIDQLKIRQFLDLLTYLLPCENCKDNYEKNLAKYPITSVTVSSRTELLKWIIQINNEVNIEQSKSLVSMDYILRKYNFDNLDGPNKTNTTFVLICVLFIVIVFWIIMFAIYR